MTAKRLKSMCLSLLTIAGVTSAAWAADESITLRYKASKTPRLFLLKTRLVQEQKLGTVDINTDTTIEDYSEWKVTKTDTKGRMSWEKDNKRYKLTMVGDAGQKHKFAYDSKSSTRDDGKALGEAVLPACEKLANSLIRFEMQPNGRIVKVTEYEKLLADVVKNDPFATQFTFAGTNAGAQLLLQETQLILPGNDVKTGDTWTVPYVIKVPGLGDMKAKKTYRLLGDGKVGSRKTVRIGISYSGEFHSRFSYTMFKGDGSLAITKSSGEAQFDRATGELVSLKSQFDFSGNIALEFDNNNKQTMTSKQRWSVEMTPLDKLPK